MRIYTAQEIARAIMHERDLSASEFEKRSHLTPRTVKLWIKGRSLMPKRRTLRILERAFNLKFRLHGEHVTGIEFAKESEKEVEARLLADPELLLSLYKDFLAESNALKLKYNEEHAARLRAQQAARSAQEELERIRGKQLHLPMTVPMSNGAAIIHQEESQNA